MSHLKTTQKIILESTPILGRDSVPILEAMDRILFEDIVAVEDFPLADVSALDGYAIRHTDIKGAGAQHPAKFKIVGEAPAGHPCDTIVGKGQAIRIMTGGLIPVGADTVIKLEDTRENRDCVFCQKDAGKGRGIRFRGEALKKGEKMLSAGDMIRPLEVGALATMRRAHVSVYRKPVVAILSTGDELCDFHEPPSSAKAMSSNLYALAAQVLKAGATPRCLGIVKDNLAAQQNLIKEALCSDVIITSGGTSKGKYDLIREAFASLGMTKGFANISLKPGKPTIFGTMGRTLIFGLPGNPSATMLSFDQFIYPALLKMTGHGNVFLSNFRHLNDPFSLIDSFNSAQGGNKDHCLASQIPLKRPKRTSLQPQEKPGPDARPGYLKIVAHGALPLSFTTELYPLSIPIHPAWSQHLCSKYSEARLYC